MAGSNLGADLGAEERMRAHERVGPQRGRLRNAAVGFRAAIDAPSIDTPEGTHDWCTAVAKALAEMSAAWQGHVRFTEDEDGLFAELLEEQVEVAAPEVDHLRRDHVVVAAAMVRAGELLGAAGAGPGEARLRDSLKAVAKQVDAHRRRGVDLLYKVYSVDPTGGG